MNTKGTTRAASLVRLSDSDFTVANAAQDVRGRKVVDRTGAKIGEVEDLLIDTKERKVRFLQAWEGGFGVLHLGKQRFLIPVDAITAIDATNVHIGQTGEQMGTVPVYDPAIVPEQAYWERLYAWYGYPPYWTRGYRYPPYPYYQTASRRYA
ncbi:MAG: PRC-barrel domain-containing protein [Thermomicrobiales bacterium]|nr:PRC-barrel domain-containing protein [Thermomicrobiales bacterium]